MGVGWGWGEVGVGVGWGWGEVGVGWGAETECSLWAETVGFCWETAATAAKI